MKLQTVLKDFRAHLERSGDSGVPDTPIQGINAMLAFYGDVRVLDVDLESDGDMLLFQWGTYDWGEGAMFELDLTRQVIGHGGEDDEIWQLHLTYRFAPSEALRAIGKGNRWCSHPDQLVEFQGFISSHPAVVAMGSRSDGDIRLEYECAG